MNKPVTGRMGRTMVTESTASEGRTADRRLVGALLHGLVVLDMFRRDRPTVGIGEMARHLGVHKSSASRIAATLAHAGFLEPGDTVGTYRLGGKLAALGTLASQDLDLERVVVPHLARLTWQTGETGHMAVLEGGNARTVSVTDGWHTVRMHSWAGKIAPAYVSSMGKALLAGLDPAELDGLYSGGELEARTERTVRSVDALVADLTRLRADGFGLDDEELEEGLRCVSAPIVGPEGTVVASISVSGPVQRLSLERVPAIAGHVRCAAAAASRALGGPPVPAGWASVDDVSPEALPWVETVRPEDLPAPA
ncbi:IclR family transcriptional regulator [Prauserella cavernicola]|uniref:IclR family transcriptional regulator n=1 Tax=Prauserella cavernicola TaxID=2800127 RepID=A0A934QZM6_9PSEU|nr:IclR family transcriptional regulator [Prauserella cavernicola]MBK1789170.1 IclR family transcriptional regulator [Prauserella cavernicola]